MTKTSIRKDNKIKNILVIGGGTGTYTVLTGLKKFPVNLSVIVTMMDSGGSNRVIRDEFGLLPTSDIRQCIVALSEETPRDILRKLFTYRYNQGTGITGMTFGNLFMAALTDIYGSQEEAVKKTCEFLDVRGKIVPVTYEKTHLVARYDNGKQILGEHFIDEPDGDLCKHRIVELGVFPPALANKEALSEIKKADLIILGPGDLYTSVLANLVVEGVVGEIAKSKAKVVFVMNLMTRYGQTTDFKASDHLFELERYLGKGRVDIVIVNKNKKLPRSVLARYKEEKASLVIDDLGNSANKRIIRGDFMSKTTFVKSQSDRLIRSLIRHDPMKLARTIILLK